MYFPSMEPSIHDGSIFQSMGIKIGGRGTSLGSTKKQRSSCWKNKGPCDISWKSWVAQTSSKGRPGVVDKTSIFNGFFPGTWSLSLFSVSDATSSISCRDMLYTRVSG